MIKSNKLTSLITIFLFFFVFSCGNGLKLPGADARKFPKDPKKRVEQNLSEGKGFRLTDITQNKGGVFEFASSNELWRASLDTIDFMPLVSANYSGGILITDWYSEGNNQKEAIKINIRFLSNEIRSDALNIDIFYRTCDDNFNCSIQKKDSDLQQELIKEILKTATLYKNTKETDDRKLSKDN